MVCQQCVNVTNNGLVIIFALCIGLLIVELELWKVITELKEELKKITTLIPLSCKRNEFFKYTYVFIYLKYLLSFIVSYSM